MIKTGDLLPEATLHEYSEGHNACPIGPQAFSLHARCAGKRVVIFGLPGAFTPTCSQRHVPGYLAAAPELFAQGVDEILCVAVNDAFVMNAWGKTFPVQGEVAMIADGNCAFTDALGLAQDSSARGMGRRSQRYALLADNLVVRRIEVDAPGKLDVSDAQRMLDFLREHDGA
ncbi:peroxiredoxin [Pseudomonas sp. SWI6]|uniref:peroxiredoxin n=1 Tax=Pseudomonas TaxID=286 RepID=UPI0003C08493|nr:MULTISPECIES: peroxiredoxin [Pseudomonas]AGZ35180.1 redoxin domain-containing protein [Pseudomonas sp. VLB120]AVD83349.1 peroxiredoxin [Pseudomonas sp. SWI6]MDT8921597.1 peroxiredoxin [Pseudomonas taiwanensis]WEZ90923.1 peroxiredoxin [Pseudomonas sp. NyZ480]